MKLIESTIDNKLQMISDKTYTWGQELEWRFQTDFGRLQSQSTSNVYAISYTNRRGCDKPVSPGQNPRPTLKFAAKNQAPLSVFRQEPGTTKCSRVAYLDARLQVLAFDHDGPLPPHLLGPRRVHLPQRSAGTLFLQQEIISSVNETRQ